MTKDLSSMIGSTPSLGTPSSGPSTLSPPNASTSTRASIDSTSAVQTRTPAASTAPSLGITSKPAAVSKGKGLALGGKKTTLADALAAEMADELGDAWGEVSAAETTSTRHPNGGSRRTGGWNAPGDLMDVNADQDDWSEQSLKALVTRNQADLVIFQPPLKVLLLVCLAFVIRKHGIHGTFPEPTIDVAWGDTLDDTPATTPSPAPAPARTPNLSTRKSPPASASLAGPPPDLTNTKSPSRAASIPSSSAPPSRIGTPQIRTSISNDWDADDGGWSGAGGGEGNSGTKITAKSLSAMSKEDKVAEMARRREERKQVSFGTECC
jgi:hypothetical protein